MVRSTISAKAEEIAVEISKDIETKLTTAELNREKEMQKKLDIIKKQVTHCLSIFQGHPARCAWIQLTY